MNDWSMLKKLIWLHIVKGGGGIERTVKGAIVHVTNALAMPAKALSVNVEPIQDLHGYDHPWPAGGGKNLLPPGSDRLSNGITFTVNNDGTVTANGTASKIAFWGAQFTIPAGTYIHSGCPSGVSGVTCDIRNRIGGTGISGIGTDGGNGVTFTISETLTAWYNIGVQPDTTLTNVVVKPMIRLASETDATFAPYSNICPISGWTEAKVYHSGEDTDNPDVLSVAFPTEAGTVYGGTLDVTTGELVVDKAIVVYDGSDDEKWQKPSSDPKRSYIAVDGIEIGTTDDEVLIGLSANMYAPHAYIGATSSASPCITGRYNIAQINVFDKNQKTMESWRSFLSLNPLEVVYPLATPTTYTLTPTQIDMLRGENNLWADAGDLTLTYYADGNASTSEALGILLGGTYNNPGGADDVSDDEALEILLGGS